MSMKHSCYIFYLLFCCSHVTSDNKVRVYVIVTPQSAMGYTSVAKMVQYRDVVTSHLQEVILLYCLRNSSKCNDFDCP